MNEKTKTPKQFEVNAPHERNPMKNQSTKQTIQALEQAVHQAREDVAGLEQKLLDLHAQAKAAQAQRDFDKAASLTTQVSSLERLLSEQKDVLTGLESELEAQRYAEEERGQVEALAEVLERINTQHQMTLEANDKMVEAILNCLAHQQASQTLAQEFNDLGSRFDDHNFASGVNLGSNPHSVHLSKKGQRLWKRLGDDANVLKQLAPISVGRPATKTLESQPMVRILSELLEDVELYQRLNG
jgi:excinuclease UvrABC nuclease subunit